MPGASTEAIRTGFASQGADNNQTVLIMEDLMDSKSLFLTPNTESIYNLMWLDTKAGPLVIETPPNVLGVIDDHWFHYVSDFGRVGPDKNKGGKFLLLPPGYTGEVPEGYFVLRSKTYGNVVFWRGFLENGSTKPAVESPRRFAKVYRLADGGNPPPMKFINVSGKAFNTIHANDFHFYDEVNNLVQYEPNEAYSPEILGTLAAIGIEKGKPFAARRCRRSAGMPSQHRRRRTPRQRRRSLSPRLKKASERSTPMVLSVLAMRERSRVVKPGPHPRSSANPGRIRTISETKASLVGSKTCETTRSRSAAKFVSPKE